MIKVGGKQKPYEMWQAGISLAASPLAKSLAGFAREGIWRLCRSPAHESRQLRRLIRSVIIRVITKSNDRFVYHEYDYRPNWTTQSQPINHKNYNFREKKNSQVMKERENLR